MSTKKFFMKQTCRFLQTSKNRFCLEGICYSDIKNTSTNRNILRSSDGAKHLPNKQTEKSFYSLLSQNGYFYITDPLSAESIASHVCKNWKEGYIFEVNPGLGVLTRALLNTGVTHLRAFEKNVEFLPVLQALANDHNNLEIYDIDFLTLPSLASKSLHNDSNDLDIIFKGIEEHSWSGGVPLRVFAIVSSKQSIKFLRFLLVALSGRTTIFSFGRSEFFLLLTEKEYKCMQAEPKGNYSTYRWATVLYNLFFEIECLDKFSHEIFFPSPVKRNKKKYEELQFYFVKMTPKRDLFTSFGYGNKPQEFYFFVRHLLAKRSSLVIPTLECWVPSCGPRLIKEGMNVFTKFGDLSPNQLVLLFNQFSSWPEYKNSTFQFALQQFYRKKETAFEEEEIS